MMGHPAMKKANLRWVDSVLGRKGSDLWPGDVGFVHPQQKLIDELGEKASRSTTAKNHSSAAR